VNPEHKRRRGGGGRGEGRGVGRYVEPSLLLLLAARAAHGYDLNERLQAVFPLPERLPELSTIYRSLADLEAQGAVRSTWTAGDGGGRKVLELTDIGRDLLASWVARFREEQAGLLRFVESFERLAETPSGPQETRCG